MTEADVKRLRQEIVTNATLLAKEDLGISRSSIQCSTGFPAPVFIDGRMFTLRINIDIKHLSGV